MAGYGNRTAPTSNPTSLTPQHETTRLNLHSSQNPYSSPHPKYGSATTAGPGFGNKSQPAVPVTNDDNDDDVHIPTHLGKDTSPYSGAGQARAGSASIGGAGYGNKTGEFGGRGDGDSRVGKVLEKAGRLVHSESLVGKGVAKRQEAVEEMKGKEEPPFAN